MSIPSRADSALNADAYSEMFLEEAMVCAHAFVENKITQYKQPDRNGNIYQIDQSHRYGDIREITLDVFNESMGTESKISCVKGARTHPVRKSFPNRSCTIDFARDRYGFLGGRLAERKITFHFMHFNEEQVDIICYVHSDDGTSGDTHGTIGGEMKTLSNRAGCVGDRIKIKRFCDMIFRTYIE